MTKNLLGIKWYRARRCLNGVLLIVALALASGSAAEPDAADAIAPSGSSPTVLVVTRAPGLGAREVEATVTNPLERHLAEAQGVRQIESHTIAGLSVIRASMRGEIRPELALAIVNAVVHGAACELPPGSSPPLVVPLDFQSTLPVAYVKVAGKTPAEAAELARTRLPWRLNDISGMGPLVVLGDKPRQILIRLDPIKLMARHLTAGDVMKAVKSHSPPVESSVLRVGSVAYTVSLFPQTIADLSATPLAAPVGHALGKLADVAQVIEAPAAPPCSTRVDGVEQVLVPIYSAKKADVARMLDDLRQAIDGLNGETAEPIFTVLPLAAGGRPESDDGLITVELRLPSGTRSAATEKERAAIEQVVQDELAGDVAFVVSEVGVEDDWFAAFSPNAAECDATLHIKLSDQRTTSTAEAHARLKSAFEKSWKAGQIHASLFMRSSASEVIEARVVWRSPDAREQLQRLLALLDTAFRHSRIVERLDAPGYQVAVDAHKAADLGVTPDQIMVPIAALTAGPVASWTDARTGARLQLVGGAENLSLEDLQNVPVATASKRPVRLGNLVQIRRTVAPIEIDHFNLEPVFRAQFVVDRSQRASAVAKLTKAADKLSLPVGPRIEVVAPGTK